MFRKIGMALLLCTVILLPAYPAHAQDGGEGAEVCSPDYIANAVRAMYDAYAVRAAAAPDSAAALQEVATLRSEIDKLYAQCSSITGAAVAPTPAPTPAPTAAPPAQTPPTASAEGGAAGNSDPGTRENPYTFNVPGDSGAGFTLRVTGYLRPADRIIRRANSINIVPGNEEEYILLDLEVVCVDGADGRCEVDGLDFELYGDLGIIYKRPLLLMFQNELDINVFNGATGTGQLAFIVRQDDTNLRLIYHGEMFEPVETVYAAEPAPGEGILAQPTINRLNIRSGPGMGYSIVGTLDTTDTVLAYGRNGDASWLNISQGWVSADFLSATGDIFALPVTGQ